MKKIFSVLIAICISLYCFCGESEKDKHLLNDFLSFRNVLTGDISYLNTYLYDYQLACLNKSELRLFRNSIYAKYGYIFKSEDLRNHFSRFSWYKGTLENVDDLLNDIDNANIRLIKTFENGLENERCIKKEEITGIWQEDYPIMPSGWSYVFIFKENGKVEYHTSQMQDVRFFVGYSGKYEINDGWLNITVENFYFDKENKWKDYTCVAPDDKMIFTYPIGEFVSNWHYEISGPYDVKYDLYRDYLVLGNYHFFRFDVEYEYAFE